MNDSIKTLEQKISYWEKMYNQETCPKEKRYYAAQIENAQAKINKLKSN